jgi:hypothetical protein
MSLITQKISLEKSIPANEQSHESIKPPIQFKQARNFKKCLDFQNKNKLNVSIKQSSNTTPTKSNSKHSSIPSEKRTIKPVFSESEEEIFVPQTTQNIEREANPTNSKNMTKKLELS